VSGIASGGDATLDSIEDAHKQACCCGCFRGLGDVVVINFAVTGGIAKDGIRTLEKVHHANLLARNRLGVGERPARPKRLGHERNADHVVSETGKRPNSKFNCLHGYEDRLLILAEQELAPDPLLDHGMEAVFQAFGGAHGS
jgi:hypothetical protein